MLNDVLQSWKVPATHTEEESWNAIQAKISQMEDTPVVSINRRRNFGWVAAAAVVVLVASILVLGPSGTEEVVADVKQEVALPDGSVAHLNNGATLAYDGDWDNREVKLQGEAFFEVTKGEKFSVVTEQGVVEVLGTSFNVYESGDLYHVDCYTGKVKVSHNGVSHIITPGQSVKVQNGELSQPFEFVRQEPNWMSSGFQYYSADLSRVIDDIAAYYNVEIAVNSEIAGVEYTGSIPEVGAEEALKVVSLYVENNYGQPLAVQVQ